MGVTLFNTLGSATEILNSIVGANGSRTGGSYAAVRFSNGYAVTGNSQYIDFSNVINKTDGSLSFWWKPNFGSTTAGNYALVSYVTAGIHIVRSIQLLRFLWVGGTGTTYCDINTSFSSGDSIFVFARWNSTSLDGDTAKKTYLYMKNLATGGSASNYGNNVAGAGATNVNTRIGNRGNNDNQMNSTIENIRIYNTANITEDFDAYNNKTIGGAKRRLS
jgi:hypothetical protein